MQKLSYVSTSAVKSSANTSTASANESIGAFLIDISGFDNPFESFPLIYQNFKDGKVQCINNMIEAERLGLGDNGFLNGLMYYHLQQFYDYVDGDQELYLIIKDCSNSWDAIYDVWTESNGKIFQVGIWTSQYIWNVNAEGEIVFTSLITDLQNKANEINGELGKPSNSPSPINIILFGNGNLPNDVITDYQKLPNAIELDCPSVSVVFAQNGTTSINSKQAQNPLKAPVSSLGIVMGCLAICGAEESIAALNKCDLNKNENFNYPELGFGENNLPIEEVNILWRNLLSSYGYIIPTDYNGYEASYFLSSDQTLCVGDFSTIANNRVLHKCRRVIHSILLPYINSNHIYNPGTKKISDTSIAMITDSINSALNIVMLNKNGQKQIDGKLIEFLDTDDILDDNSISIRILIKPANYDKVISEEVSQ